MDFYWTFQGLQLFQIFDIFKVGHPSVISWFVNPINYGYPDTRLDRWFDPQFMDIILQVLVVYIYNIQ
jgi:hypothetical protein